MSWTIAIKRGDPQRELKMGRWKNEYTQQPRPPTSPDFTGALGSLEKKKYSDKTRKKANSLWIFTDIPYAPS
jgi:hypothetical protein